MYNNLNQRLSDMRSGNYLVKVSKIGDKRWAYTMMENFGIK